MKKSRRTRTSVEVREVVVIRRSRTRNRILCPECSGAAALLTVEEAVKISAISSRAIFRLIEEGEVHFTETVDGLTLICPTTLLAKVE